MNPRLQTLRDRVRSRGQAAERTTPIPDILAEWDVENLTWMQRSARLTRADVRSRTPADLGG
jgi:hypothetical protein